MTAFGDGPDGILLLKIVVTPLLVLAASLAGRFWGQSIGGWLIGLPLTSGPISFFLVIDHGSDFVRDMAIGVVSGAAAQGAFCVAYAYAVARRSWVWSLGAGLLAYGLAVTVIRALGLPFNLVVLVALLVLLFCARLMPRQRHVAAADLVHPSWDLPARMAVATMLVVGLTAAAPLTGAWLNGVLATVPVFGSVLAVFAHRNYGSGAALHLLVGFLFGAFAVIGFFLALANLITPIGIAASFAAAIVAALAVQGFTLWSMRRPTKV